MGVKGVSCVQPARSHLFNVESKTTHTQWGNELDLCLLDYKPFICSPLCLFIS